MLMRLKRLIKLVLIVAVVGGGGIQGLVWRFCAKISYCGNSITFIQVARPARNDLQNLFRVSPSQKSPIFCPSILLRYYFNLFTLQLQYTLVLRWLVDCDVMSLLIDNKVLCTVLRFMRYHTACLQSIGSIFNIHPFNTKAFFSFCKCASYCLFCISVLSFLGGFYATCWDWFMRKKYVKLLTSWADKSGFFCNMLILIQERKNIKTFNIMGRQKWWKTFQQNVVPERRKENRSNNTGLELLSLLLREICKKKNCLSRKGANQLHSIKSADKNCQYRI